eukprot:TRINITY_DN12503_c0_g1::TRINITY_DN12503_c0_g1_i1::g.15063::m.15063 TRINITY_DN12503_c0_g1::TRINITY_DN12503_c0_g1_i1::g.15063  ORF type:complete len:448 (+),score=89.94,sp/Q969H0/FBXW7_HUMAN/28.81/4e-22,sp/Q969H0/FBXW7_HUMAN/25.26/5e-18,WD40/PF00400.27/0.00038,WD40/PF00400.27/0.021,WD40/PF00400.27/8.1e-08,WD40/PF00400.27/5.4e-06,WD40/PF00400.27/5,WD40/PF00400.27/0.22,WD40/PF00400.27/0.51,PQQ_3/PF13570.1/2.4e+02,PQQ_3/PF13570.1/5.4,PQQ_3/PF13570.1/0.84,PQQ_3/PF13570.1/68,PQQ_3/PF13570.1/1.3e+04,PQQ_
MAGRGAPKYSAAQSHQLNDKYMDEFEEGLAQLEGRAPAKSDIGAPRMGGDIGNSLADGMSALSIRNSLSPGWASGPMDPEGILFDASDRPIMCGSLHGDEAILGCSDHALYGVNIRTGKKTRQLHTKQCGHSEWITTVAHTSDGTVISGGMDNKLCVWDSGTRCVDLLGHSGPIAMVHTATRAPIAVSASYDKTLKVWNVSRKKELSTLSGHSGPVLDFAWSDSGVLVSGGRDGLVIAWDAATGASTRKLKGHLGHVTAVTCFADGPTTGTPASGSVFVTGAQDGHIRVWDMRAAHALVAKVENHVTAEGGSGAVGFIKCATGVLCTAGADKTVQILDSRESFAVRHRFTHHRDFIYGMEVIDDGRTGYILSGGGDGALIVHDLYKGKCIYGLGANQNAVRVILASGDTLVTAGDDGKVLTYKF